MAKSIDMAAHVRRINAQDKVATGILTVIVGLVLLILAAIIVYILAAGIGKAVDINFLTGDPEQFKAGGGIGPELFNSFYLLVLTLIISVPISLGAAIFLAEYAPENGVTAAAKTLIETLSSLPSIVVGLFGFLFFVLMMGWGFSIISGAIALTMFNIPILVRVIQQALEDVPRSQRDAALAMGLTRWETTIHVLLPAAMPAIVTGIVLSAGRVFGEAAALIYTAGQSAPSLDFTNFDLSSPTCPWEHLPPGGNARRPYLEDQQRGRRARPRSGVERHGGGAHCVHPRVQPDRPLRGQDARKEADARMTEATSIDAAPEGALRRDGRGTVGARYRVARHRRGKPSRADDRRHRVLRGTRGASPHDAFVRRRPGDGAHRAVRLRVSRRFCGA